MDNQELSLPPPLPHHKTVTARADEIIKNQDLLDRIRMIVVFYHIIISQSYMFAKYIFTRIFSDTDSPAELIRDLRQDPTILFNEFFFYRIISTFAGIREETEVQTPETQYVLRTINLYLADYLELSGFEIAPSSYLFTTRIYEARKMLKAYRSMIIGNFSKVYSRIINIYAGKEQRRKDITERLHIELGNRLSDKEFEQHTKDTFHNEIISVLCIVKDIMAHRQPNRQALPTSYENVYDETEFIRQCYPLNYDFKNNNIHDDCAANPWNHIETYFRMTQHLESLGLHHNRCFPLRTQFSPKYLSFDRQSLIEICGHSTKMELINENLNRFFAKIFNIRHNAFSEGRRQLLLTKEQLQQQQQEDLPEYSFKGRINTDGYGISIQLSNKNCDDSIMDDAMQPSHHPARIPKVKAPKKLSYIHEMTPEQLTSLGPNIIFCDPGQSDLLYMMHLDSLPKEKLTLRYTNSTSRILTNKKYDAEQKKKEALMSNLNDNVTDLAVKETQPQTLITTLSNSKHNTTYASYIHAKKECSKLYNFYSEYRDPDASEDNDFATGNELEASHVRNEIKRKFGHLGPIVIIIGDWSITYENAHKQMPLQSKLLRKLLAEEFTVHLIDEYNTSKICPLCDSETEPFLPITDPRQQQQSQKNALPRVEPDMISNLSLVPLEEGQIRSNRLLRCLGSNCKVMINNELRTRFHNRNLMAVLNFKRIFLALRDGQPLPARLTKPVRL